MTSKIYKVGEDYDVIVSQITKDKKKIVFTNGCFDILHVGHAQYLYDCKLRGDFLIVGLNTDASIKINKGDNRPIQNEDDRAIILASLACVDLVILFDQPTPLDIIQKVNPDLLIKGGDYLVKDIVGRQHVEEKGGEVMTIPLTAGKSTSAIIQKIKKLP